VTEFEATLRLLKKLAPQVIDRYKEDWETEINRVPDRPRIANIALVLICLLKFKDACKGWIQDDFIKNIKTLTGQKIVISDSNMPKVFSDINIQYNEFYENNKLPLKIEFLFGEGKKKSGFYFKYTNTNEKYVINDIDEIKAALLDFQDKLIGKTFLTEPVIDFDDSKDESSQETEGNETDTQSIKSDSYGAIILPKGAFTIIPRNENESLASNGMEKSPSISDEIGENDSVLILEGITLCQMGEIYHESPDFPIEHKWQVEPYRKTIESFITGGICFEFIGLDEEVITPKDEMMGKYVKAKTFLDIANVQKRLRSLKINEIKDLEIFSQGESSRKSILNNIKYLSKAIQLRPYSWMALFARESDRIKNNNEINHPKDCKYLYDEELCGEIAKETDVIEMALPIYKKIVHKDEEILKLIIQGMILTHLAIREYYMDRNSETTKLEGFQHYGPCPTRESIDYLGSQMGGGHKNADLLRIQELMLPNCVYLVLENCQSPQELLSAIEYVRGTPPFPAVRQKIIDANIETGKKRVAKLKTIKNDLSKLIANKDSQIEVLWEKYGIHKRSKWQQEVARGGSPEEKEKEKEKDIDQLLRDLFPVTFDVH